MSVQSERPQRLMRAPTAPRAQAYVSPAATEAEPPRAESPRSESPRASSRAPKDAPIESIVADLQGAPRYLLPLIALGVALVGAVAAVILT
ncbi:MAG: hypothetical protein U1F43_25350 [Myxococcota bacterium]